MRYYFCSWWCDLRRACLMLFLEDLDKLCLIHQLIKFGCKMGTFIMDFCNSKPAILSNMPDEKYVYTLVSSIYSCFQPDQPNIWCIRSYSIFLCFRLVLLVLGFRGFNQLFPFDYLKYDSRQNFIVLNFAYDFDLKVLI